MFLSYHFEYSIPHLNEAVLEIEQVAKMTIRKQKLGKRWNAPIL